MNEKWQTGKQRKKDTGGDYLTQYDEIKKVTEQLHQKWILEALNRSEWKCMEVAYILQGKDIG